MSLFKKVAKSVSKKATKVIGGKPSPSLGKVWKAAKTYNPVTGIKKVTKAMQPKPQSQRKGRR